MRGGTEPMADMQSFKDDIAACQLTPLWEVLHNLVPAQPSSPAKPHIWSYPVARSHLMRAGELITAEQAERRVLILENPGLPGSSAITQSLYAGLQLVLPGEVAPCHRHAQSALRFVLEGSGAHTAVNGEKVLMEPFDLILTPSGLWHDHGNETADPVVWLDGLDIPLIQMLDCSYAERYNENMFPVTREPGDTRHRYGRNLRPVRRTDHDAALKDQPLFHYPFAEWREALGTMASSTAPDAYDGHKYEFINPLHGGATMKTISCFCQLIPKGMTTLPHRSTDGVIYTVCEGEGTARISHQDYPLSPQDVLVVPSWNSLEIEAADDLVLFSFSDKTVQDKLGVWREERL